MGTAQTPDMCRVSPGHHPQGHAVARGLLWPDLAWIPSRAEPKTAEEGLCEGLGRFPARALGLASRPWLWLVSVLMTCKGQALSPQSLWMLVSWFPSGEDTMTWVLHEVTFPSESSNLRLIEARRDLTHHTALPGSGAPRAGLHIHIQAALGRECRVRRKLFPKSH